MKGLALKRWPFFVRLCQRLAKRLRLGHMVGGVLCHALQRLAIDAI
jgi:hypothetical protein|tara:strand:- start:72 stop:209 length:138 start_codon:yes stop_codon:yes gene_type:complete